MERLGDGIDMDGPKHCGGIGEMRVYMGPVDNDKYGHWAVFFEKPTTDGVSFTLLDYGDAVDVRQTVWIMAMYHGSLMVMV